MNGLALDAYLIGLRATLPLAMRLLPLPALFAAIAPRRIAIDEARARVAIARSERLAPRLRLANTCLYRALARFVALRAAGLEASFHMGVWRDDPEGGHAWVELAGAPVNEAADERLVQTFRFP